MHLSQPFQFVVHHILLVLTFYCLSCLACSQCLLSSLSLPCPLLHSTPTLCSQVFILAWDAIYFLNFKESRIRVQGTFSASLCSLAGRYDNPIPTRFLARIDCSKIPALLAVSLLLLSPNSPASCPACGCQTFSARRTVSYVRCAMHIAHILSWTLTQSWEPIVFCSPVCVTDSPSWKTETTFHYCWRVKSSF